VQRRVDLAAPVVAPDRASAQDIAEVDGFPAFTAEVDAEIREWVGSHGSKWTKLREHLKSDDIAMGGFPSVVLTNRWHQLQIEDCTRSSPATVWRA
jgi:hypothetical protein